MLAQYRHHFGARDQVHFFGGGGPGWGPAFERSAEAVREDVIDGYVSVTAARDEYGVAVREDDLELDEAATARLRAKPEGSSARS